MRRAVNTTISNGAHPCSVLKFTYEHSLVSRVASTSIIQNVVNQGYYCIRYWFNTSFAKGMSATRETRECLYVNLRTPHEWALFDSVVLTARLTKPLGDYVGVVYRTWFIYFVLKMIYCMHPYRNMFVFGLLTMPENYTIKTRFISPKLYTITHSYIYTICAYLFEVERTPVAASRTKTKSRW